MAMLAREDGARRGGAVVGAVAEASASGRRTIWSSPAPERLAASRTFSATTRSSLDVVAVVVHVASQVEKKVGDSGTSARGRPCPL